MGDSPVTSSQTPSQRKIRYAVVGLGWFAQAAALPAFATRVFRLL